MAAVINKELMDAIRRGRYLHTISLPDDGTVLAGTGWGYNGVGATSYNYQYPSAAMEDPAISGVCGMMIGDSSDISEVAVQMIDPTNGIADQQMDFLCVNRPLLYQIRSNHEALSSGMGLKRIRFSASSLYSNSYIRVDNGAVQAIADGPLTFVTFPVLSIALFLLETPNQVPLKRSAKHHRASTLVTDPADPPSQILPCMGRKKICGFVDSADTAPGAVADCRITILRRCYKGVGIAEPMIEEQIWPVGGGAVRVDGKAGNATGPRVANFSMDIPEDALFVVTYNKGAAADLIYFGITLED